MIILSAPLSPIQRIPSSLRLTIRQSRNRTPRYSLIHSSGAIHFAPQRERVAREGWRETAVVEKETDICTCFPNPPPPRPGEKRSGSRSCEEGKERRKT